MDKQIGRGVGKGDSHTAVRTRTKSILTVRLLTHVLCKPTHFFFHAFIATISYSLQTKFNSIMKDWADKYHVWGYALYIDKIK